MGFNSAFKGLNRISPYDDIKIRVLDKTDAEQLSRNFTSVMDVNALKVAALVT